MEEPKGGGGSAGTSKSESAGGENGARDGNRSRRSRPQGCGRARGFRARAGAPGPHLAPSPGGQGPSSRPSCSPLRHARPGPGSRTRLTGPGGRGCPRADIGAGAGHAGASAKRSRSCSCAPGTRPCAGPAGRGLAPGGSGPGGPRAAAPRVGAPSGEGAGTARGVERGGVGRAGPAPSRTDPRRREASESVGPAVDPPAHAGRAGGGEEGPGALRLLPSARQSPRGAVARAPGLPRPPGWAAGGKTVLAVRPEEAARAAAPRPGARAGFSRVSVAP